MATFTYTPDFEGVEVSAPRVRETRLGDGYSHRIRFGIHTDLKEWQLTFENRSDDETASITGFLAERAGAEAFDWTPPSTGSVSGKFVCAEWQVTMKSYNLNSIRATFREVAEP